MLFQYRGTPRVVGQCSIKMFRVGQMSQPVPQPPVQTTTLPPLCATGRGRGIKRRGRIATGVNLFAFSTCGRVSRRRPVFVRRRGRASASGRAPIVLFSLSYRTYAAAVSRVR